MSNLYKTIPNSLFMDVNHIGFIMDGNRRYSKKNNLSKEEGYKAGMMQFLNFVKFQIKYNLPETSFFALSNDNFHKRPVEEKKILAKLIKFFSLEKEIWDFLFENKVRVEIKGNLAEVEDKETAESEEEGFFISTLKNKIQKHNYGIGEYKYKTNIAINYDGQEEILHSVKNILKKINSGELEENQISVQTIKDNIHFSNSLPPEIIVRPGDAPRLSGFMLWDSEYSEIYLTKKLWPELDEEDFKEILDWYASIKRNFGK